MSTIITINEFKSKQYNLINQLVRTQCPQQREYIVGKILTLDKIIDQLQARMEV